MPASPKLQTFISIVVLLIGSAGVAALWTLLSVALERHCAWMAVVAAIDAAILLRMFGVPRGPARALLAIAGTALAIVLANWAIAATEIGQMVGLVPWQAIPRMGPDYAWTLLSLANGAVDVIWYVAALAVAAFAAR